MFDTGDILDSIQFEDPAIETLSFESVPILPVSDSKNFSDMRSMQDRIKEGNNGHRRSHFIKRGYDRNYARTDLLDHVRLWSHSNLPSHAAPNGFKGDSTIAFLWFRFLPDHNWQKLGVINIVSNKRGKCLIFKANEMNFIIPEFRVSIYVLLREHGLISDEIIKDSNMPKEIKGQTILASLLFQKYLNISVEKGNNPTLPYTLTSDLRDKKPIEKQDYTATVKIRKFLQIGTQADLEIKRLQTRAIASEKALKRATRDISKLESEREDRLYPVKLQTARIKATHNLVDRL